MNEEFLKEFLNPEQIKAVLFDDNAVVMACPGGGKTRTLVYKIAYQLSKGDGSKNIIAITYTNNAADEIKKRILEMGVSVEKLWIGTIHSFCIKWILKPYSGVCDEIKFGYRIIDPHHSESLKAEVCQKHKIKIYDVDFGWCETGLREFKPNHIAVVEEYYNHLREQGYIDFDYIIYLSFKILRSNSFIANNLSNIFKLILIDEYQDTQILQYELLFDILKSNGESFKLFFVGDPNQAIFNSMGGVALAFNSFSNRSGIQFTLLELKDNYRSSQKVVDYFSLFKTINRAPFEASGDLREYESKITLNNSCSVDGLDGYIQALIENMLSEGIQSTEICIIAPWWFHLSDLTRRLMAIMPEVSFNGPGVTPISSNRESLWYKFARLALTRPSPQNYRSRVYYANEAFSQLSECGLKVNDEPSEIKVFLKYCNSLKVNEVDGIKYLDVFFTEVIKFFDFDILQIEEFSESREAFFASAEKRKKKLNDDGLGLLTSAEHYKKMFDKKTGVTVTTIHSVKGLEFDCVIAFGLLQGIVPRFGEDEAQSKRLLYVLSSRARKHLHLISEINRNTRTGQYKITNVLKSIKYVYSGLEP
ncbi:UvrD-helicase domain-containing protein [Pantoea agglomerans]|uniref:UvrD-helicase domain-containing protein n=1 Tax=Enterobacter agglomerans TaxID=549 RepID=UPI00263B445D|nr:ATP-dependent helicase [Pantoea agglomerans]MDN4624121.1 ATP-dependent helicase [Pantoea agglomerans]